MSSSNLNSAAGTIAKPSLLARASSITTVDHTPLANLPQLTNPSSSSSSSSSASSSAVASSPHSHDDDSNERYSVSAEGYRVIEEIGTGAFAIVYRAVVLRGQNSGQQVAIKIMDLESLDTSWDEVRREIATMSFLHHDNVVPIYTSFVHQADLWLVMPLLEAGSCASIIKKIAPKGLKDEQLIITILHETLKGLHYLHSDGRIHRDVKAGNILIGWDGRVQLGDFGVATTLLENGDRKKSRTTFTGTPCWMAPEVMEHGTEGYDEKADIWSFGITALELAYGRAPYSKFQPMKVMLLTLQEDPPTCDIYNDNSYNFSKNFKSFVAKCLTKNPAQRPNSKKLLQHKIFKDLEKDSKRYVVQHVIEKVTPLKSISDAVVSNPGFSRPNGASSSSAAGGGGAVLAPGAGQGDGKAKPISVGAFFFTQEEFEEYERDRNAKQHLQQQHLAAAAAAPSSSSSAAGFRSSSPLTDDDDAGDSASPAALSPQPNTVHHPHQHVATPLHHQHRQQHHHHHHHHHHHDDDVSVPVFHGASDQ